MNTVLLKSNSKDDLLLLIKLADKLGVKAEMLTEKDVEDICLARAIKEGKTNEYVTTEDVIQKLCE